MQEGNKKNFATPVWMDRGTKIADALKNHASWKKLSSTTLAEWIEKSVGSLVQAAQDDVRTIVAQDAYILQNRQLAAKLVIGGADGIHAFVDAKNDPESVLFEPPVEQTAFPTPKHKPRFQRFGSSARLQKKLEASESCDVEEGEDTSPKPLDLHTKFAHGSPSESRLVPGTATPGYPGCPGGGYPGVLNKKYNDLKK